jgi:ketosteroid isomerase-like protein
MSEIEKIRECSSAFDEALKVGDGDKCASFYIPDGVLLFKGAKRSENTLPISGRIRL